MRKRVFALPIVILGVLQILHFASSASLRKRKNEVSCGYQSCPKTDPNKLNIHLVAHTHDDVGWLKTVDQYYFGSRSMIQKAGVQYILDSVVEALVDHPDRRFIYVETAFLWKWWQRQNDKTKDRVKSLIDEGRLEIIGGAWSMNDEATTHYQSTVDQFTWGFRRLNDTFGKCARPKIGWQIDPFGHSREQASLFAQMGFDGMLFGRLDYQDKEKRLTDKSAEFIWESSSSLGDRANLFTAAMFNTYSPPPGFCFDVLCADEPIIDDTESPDYNVPRRINDFLNYTTRQSRYFRTNNIILTMGGDFTYQFAEMYFKNLDKLIRYTNELNGSDVNVFYSTPSCYLKSLQDAKLYWPTKADDFFPYASDPHAYWTGYFTSRPTIKFYERFGNNFLQIGKQLSVLTNEKTFDKELEQLREVMGVMQHHDAVTGTEKQHVSDDYARMLHESITGVGKLIKNSLRKWTGAKNDKEESNMHFCHHLNISACVHTENNKEFRVTVYNPLGKPLTTYIRLPVQGTNYLVTDHNGAQVNTQVVPIPDPIKKIPGRVSNAMNELVFRAIELPALGYRTYLVKETTTLASVYQSKSFKGKRFSITFDNDGHVRVRSNNSALDFVQSFHFYEGAEGNNMIFENRSSGAYIFRPKTGIINLNYTGNYEVHSGPLVEEHHVKINNWVSQIVRMYEGENNLEFDWLVGPIPIDDKIGKEIITKYSSNLNTSGIFYTDSNGREMLKRKRNYRPTWPVRLEEKISGNYYPVTAKISIKDENLPVRISILNDRAQGGSSLNDGEIELMLHRRLLKDDAFGVGEALNETAYGEGLVARGRHIVHGGDVKDVDRFVQQEKDLALRTLLRPIILVTPTQGVTYEEWSRTHETQNSGLAMILPPNVHILTLEPWKADTILLRLEHIFEVNETKELSKPVTVNLKNLFSTLIIEKIEETTLGGNQWLEDLNRFQWMPETNNIQSNVSDIEPVEVKDDAINVIMKPMEIRTFIVTVSRSLF